MSGLGRGESLGRDCLLAAYIPVLRPGECAHGTRSDHLACRGVDLKYFIYIIEIQTSGGNVAKVLGGVAGRELSSESAGSNAPGPGRAQAGAQVPGDVKRDLARHGDGRALLDLACRVDPVLVIRPDEPPPSRRAKRRSSPRPRFSRHRRRYRTAAQIRRRHGCDRCHRTASTEGGLPVLGRLA